VFLIYVGSFGANEYMLKIGAFEFGRQSHDRILQIRTNALFYGVMTTATLSFLILLLSKFFRNDLITKVISYSIIIAIPTICYNIYDSFYRSTQKYLIFSGMILVKSIILLLIGYLFVNLYGVNAAIAAESLSVFIVFIVLFLSDVKSNRISKINHYKIELNAMLKNGYSIILAYMTRSISLMFERYFISFALGLAVLGKYTFVMIVYQATIISGSMITNLMGPRWLQSYSSAQNMKLLMNKIHQALLFSVLLALIIFPIFYFSFPILLETFFHKYNHEDIILMGCVVYWTSLCYLVISFLDWFFVAVSKERLNLLITLGSFLFVLVSFLFCFIFNLSIEYYVYSIFLNRFIVMLSMILISINIVKLKKLSD
jgi:O-antigen/teichoic acid export membrane protein